MIQVLKNNEREGRMYLKRLKDILDKNEISYCVVANLDTNSVDMIGDAAELEYKDIVEQLFGNVQQIKLLNDSLAEQTLPRSWKQGKVKCLVCKPTDSTIVGVFYDENRSFIESIDFSNEIAISINNIWKR